MAKTYSDVRFWWVSGEDRNHQIILIDKRFPQQAVGYLYVGEFEIVNSDTFLTP